MDRRKKSKGEPRVLETLAPEAEARLAGQVAGVVAALESGAGQAELQAQLTPDPQDAEWDVRLMAALGALRHPVIPALLVSLFGGATGKVRRKALKKTLHLLKTRGVPVPEDLLPREEVSLGGPRPGRVGVFVTPIFGNGEGYVILEGPQELLGGNFLVNLVSDREGLRECVLLNLKRKQQADFWDQFRKQGLEEFFTPPPAFAVARLEEAYKAHPGAPGAAQYGVVREKIFQHWGRPDAAFDLEQALPASSPGEQTRLLDESRKLAADPLFHSWLPGPAEISPWLTKLQEVQDSPLVLSDQQKQVRLEAVLDEATGALYPPETRDAWGRRLKVTAYFLHLKGREEDARTAGAAARDLADPNRSALAGESPFLKGLVQFAVRLAWEAKQPREEAAGSGLVAPPDSSRLILR